MKRGMPNVRRRRPDISRRTLLRGLLGGAAVTVGLPPLELFMNTHGEAYADGPFPKRFGMFFWGNGVLPDRWNPEGDGPDWELSPQLAPLAPVKDDVTVVTGTRVRVPNVWPHLAGPAGFLSGLPLVVLGEDDATFGGPTIDQQIADQIGSQTLFRSLEFGAQPETGLSFIADGVQNPPESSPFALFERVFGPSFRLPGEGEADPALGHRRSVLDAVLEQSSGLRARLGSADQTRLDQHLNGVRELELQLARLQEDPPSLDACVRPDAPEAEYPFIDGRPQLAAANRAFCDLVALALACDQTRVFTNWLTAPVNNLLFPGADGGHHQLTHDEPGDQPQVHEIVLQVVEEYAYLVSALRNIEEGDGTLLDSCAVLGTTDCSFGRTHSIDDYPILIAGTAGGALQRGIHYRSRTGENASSVMLSLIRAVGGLASGFGEGDARSENGLSGIET